MGEYKAINYEEFIEELESLLTRFCKGTACRVDTIRIGWLEEMDQKNSIPLNISTHITR